MAMAWPVPTATTSTLVPVALVYCGSSQSSRPVSAVLVVVANRIVPGLTAQGVAAGPMRSAQRPAPRPLAPLRQVAGMAQPAGAAASVGVGGCVAAWGWVAAGACVGAAAGVATAVHPLRTSDVTSAKRQSAFKTEMRCT